MKPKINRLYTFFFRGWWTVLAILFCYGFYLHGMQKKKELFSELKRSVDLLENQLYTAIDSREDLLSQMDSQNDPAWVEMLIKKHLGMVPYGQTKIYFERE